MDQVELSFAYIYCHQKVFSKLMYVFLFGFNFQHLFLMLKFEPLALKWSLFTVWEFYSEILCGRCFPADYSKAQMFTRRLSVQIQYSQAERNQLWQPAISPAFKFKWGHSLPEAYRESRVLILKKKQKNTQLVQYKKIPTSWSSSTLNLLSTFSA